MTSRPLMRLRLVTAPIQDVGLVPLGRLTIFPVVGGTFDGERLRGTGLPGGGDWVAATPGGTFELDLRVTLEADDGALIRRRSQARRREPLLPHLALRDGVSVDFSITCLRWGSEGASDGPVHSIGSSRQFHRQQTCSLMARELSREPDHL